MQLPENYTIIEKDVKHARLRVSEDRQIRIIVPPSFSDLDVENLLVKKQKWIEKHLKFFSEKSKINLQRNQILLFGNRYNYFYDSTFSRKVTINHEFKSISSKLDLLDIPTQEKWLKKLAKSYLTNRTSVLAESLGFRYNRIFIRNQKRKWGNCSAEKNISLNWRLIKAPTFVIDYLIIHELVHTLVMNHTHKFWTLLRAYYPDYKDSVRWLVKYGNSL